MAVHISEIPRYEVLRKHQWANYEYMAAVRLHHLETMRARHPEGLTDETFYQELLAWGRIQNATEVMWDAMERLWKGAESPLLSAQW